VLLIAASPDPTGTDTGGESVTLLNTSPSAIDLDDWQLSDAAGGRQTLSGQLEGGATMRITLQAPIRLGNRGDTISLINVQGTTVDQITYQASQVRAGRTIPLRR
jgi:hypothetical protein